MPTVRRLTALAAALAALAAATGEARAAGASFSAAPIRLDVEATPGRPYTDALEINNEAREPARIKVYAEDWRLERDGAVTFSRAGTGPRSASTWIRLNPTEFDLPPLATADVRFTVTVPRGAPAGGYRAAIVVEQAPRPTPDGEAKREMAIRARIASVIYVRVGDPVADAAIQGVAFRREEHGRRAVVVTVENRGAVHFRTAGRVVLQDSQSGRALHRLPLPDVPLLPESLRDVRVEVPAGVRPGTYDTRVELEVGRAELFVHEGRVAVE